MFLFTKTFLLNTNIKISLFIGLFGFSFEESKDLKTNEDIVLLS